jgi:hypothetical protein
MAIIASSLLRDCHGVQRYWKLLYVCKLLIFNFSNTKEI